MEGNREIWDAGEDVSLGLEGLVGGEAASKGLEAEVMDGH